nr:endonuclease/exonuclease/phosphatase family protein [uncultured Alistipes sp.]
MTWAQLREKATGKEFYYLNTHFDHMGETARRESARMVADFVRERIPDDATVIVGGDLNTDAAHPDLAPLKEQLRIARDIADPTDRRGTFNGFGSTPGNIVIDHIFCRNVSGPALETLRDGYGAAYLSDHYPVVFTFRLP